MFWKKNKLTKNKLTKEEIDELISLVEDSLQENANGLWDGLSKELSSTDDKFSRCSRSFSYAREYQSRKKWLNEILEKLKSL